jgi:flagella basal body P-ring formation protein FlgA
MRSRIVTALVALALAGTASAAEIRMRPQCTASRGILTLGDLAEIIGTDPAEVAQLAATELAPAPPPGQQRFFRIREIQDALWARGVNLASHELSGYGQTVVMRPTDQPPKAEKPAPKPKVREKAEPREPAMTPAVVPLRPIPRGVVIRPEDVQVTTVPAKGRQEVFCSVEEVVGRETTRPLAEGRPLDRDALRSQILVRRGEQITLFACAPGMKVKMAARSREDGALDQQVSVETLPERRTLLARVAGFQEAEVCPSQPASVGRQPASVGRQPASGSQAARPARTSLARNKMGQKNERNYR